MPTICCCLRPGEDRRLLTEWLDANGYEPVVSAPDELSSTSFDCCLVDLPSLRDGESALRDVRTTRDGIVPCLLIAGGDADETLSRLPRSVAAVVTDVLGTPLRTTVLRRRLENALSLRQLTMALVGNRERYRRLVEGTPAAVFLLTDGDITDSNDAAERLVGRDPEEMDGERFVRLFTEPDRDRIDRLLSELSGPEPTEFVEASMIGRDRSVPVELAATAIRDHADHALSDPVADDTPGSGFTSDVQVVVHDASRRKAREEQLRLYRRAIDAATIGITISNPSLPDNPLVYVNEEFERLTGRSREEILGRNPRVLQCPDSDPETIAQLREAIDAGEPVSVEILNERADGSRWYNALEVTPIYGPGGDVEYFLGFQRDVTNRREREIRLTVLDRVLRHNLRNRLNVVLGHVNEIEDGSDDIEFHTGRIRSAAESLLSLSDAARRFRSVLKERRADDGPIRLDREVANTVDALRNVNQQAAIETRLQPVTVRSGAGLTVAVEELVSNALAHCDRDPEVVVTVRRTDDEAVLSVADNGPGIPEAERRALSGDEETPIDHASGLGLWLVQWVVDDAGGSVTYDDNDPRGSIVTLRVPIVSDDAPR